MQARRKDLWMGELDLLPGLMMQKEGVSQVIPEFRESTGISKCKAYLECNPELRSFRGPGPSCKAGIIMKVPKQAARLICQEDLLYQAPEILRYG